MPKTVYTKDGKTVTVSDADAQAGVAAGKYAFGAQDKVHVVDSAGRVGTVDAGDAAAAFQSGMRLASGQEVAATARQEKYGKIGGQIIAGAEGFARGATLGLVDPLATGLAGAFGGEDAAEATRQHLAAEKEVNPYASGGGELAGAIVPGLLTDGAGFAAEGAEGAAEGGSVLRALGAAPRAVSSLGEGAAGFVREGLGAGEATGLLGRAAQRVLPGVARGTVEGALYGAGNAASNAALSEQHFDTDQVAQMLLAGASDGALLGGVGGAALSGLGLAGSEAASKLSDMTEGLGAGEGTSLQQSLKKFSDERTIKALGAKQTDIARLGRSTEDIERRLSEISDTVHAAKLENGTKVFGAGQTAAEMAPKLQQAVDESSDRLANIRQKLYATAKADPSVGPDMAKVFGETDKALAPMRSSMIPDIQRKASRVDDTISGLRAKFDAGEKVGLEELTDFRKQLDDVIYPKAPAGKGLPPMAPEHAAELQQVRGIVENEIEAAADRAAQKAGGNIGEDYRNTKREFRNLLQAKQMAEGWAVRDLGNRALSPTDYLTGVGIAAHGGEGGGMLGAGVAGLAGSLLHNVVRERGASIAASLARRASGIDGVVANAAQTEAKITGGVRGFLSGSAKAVERVPAAATTAVAAAAAQHDPFARRKNETTADHMARVSQHLAQVTTDPNYAATLAANKLGDLHTVAPATAAKATATMMSAAQYLQAHMPPSGPDPRSLTPQATKIQPSKAEVVDFQRRVRAIRDPSSVIDDMKAGRATPEGVDALKAVYPAVYSTMVDSALRELTSRTEKEGPLPYQKRVQMSILLSVPTDATLTPDFVASIQSKIAQPPPGPENGPATPPPGHPLAHPIQLSGARGVGTNEEHED